MITTICVIDTETSDLPENDGKLLEVASIAAQLEQGKWVLGDAQSWLVAFEGAIAPTAQAAHHITLDMVSPSRIAGPNNPDSNVFERDGVVHSLCASEVPGEMVWAAHHAPFEQKMLPELTLPWIDTCQCAKHIWPSAPSFKNEVLRYWLNLFPPPELLGQSHRAQHDAAVTATILQHMLRGHTVEQLIELSDKPAVQLMCRFGKHRGEAWEYIPKSYLRWMQSSSDMYRDDREIRATVDHHLSTA